MPLIRSLLVTLVALLGLLLVTPRAVANDPPAERGVLRVAVSIPPLKGLVEPLLPPGSTLTLLIPPGVSEHGYEIPPRTLAALARAEIVVYVGLGLEPQVERFLSQHGGAGRSAVSFAAVAGLNVDPSDHSAHAHDAEGNCLHTPGAADPHVWLSPVESRKLVVAVAEAIRQRLRAGGAGEAALARLAEAEAEQLRRLDQLHNAYAARLAKTIRRTVVVTHDAYGHLARQYGFETVAIKGLNAGEPTPKAIESAAETIRRTGLPVVFVEPQLSPAAAKRVADATGTRVLTLDPLGDGDYFAFMHRNLDALAAALGVVGEEPARETTAAANR
jgi:zinc transport system substrate-binding protein